MDIERQPLSKQWVLVLDQYEAVNLAAVLADISGPGPGGQLYNTGDWINQIRWKLPNSLEGIEPNPIRGGS